MYYVASPDCGTKYIYFLDEKSKTLFYLKNGKFLKSTYSSVVQVPYNLKFIEHENLESALALLELTG